MTVFDMSHEFPRDEGAAAEADSIDLINRRVIQALTYRIKNRQITKKQLADRLGLNKSEVSRLLRGNSNITARKLGRLLWALDYDFDLLLCDMAAVQNNTAKFDKVQCVQVVMDIGKSQENNITSNVPSLQMSKVSTAPMEAKFTVAPRSKSRQIGKVELHVS